MNNPLFSIITPTLNRATTICEAIDSVLGQEYMPFEHIIIDGGSTDNTLKILAKYPHLKILSEPDQGIWDALNKGIALAKGEIIGHLNSDDRYMPGAFKKLCLALRNNPGAQAFCGGAEIFQTGPDGRDQVLFRYNNLPIKTLRLSDITRYVPITNARFFGKDVYQKVGPYNQEYALAADRDFFLRVWLAGIKTIPLEGVVYQYRWHRDSLTIKGSEGLQNPSRDDYLRICEAYLGSEGLPAEVREELLRWRAWEMICRSMDLAKAGAWKAAGDAFRRAIRTDPASLFRFAGLLPGRLAGSGKRGHDEP